MSIAKKNYEKRMRRMLGASSETKERIKQAEAEQLWWARCWNCRRSVSMLKHDLEHSNCPHCGVNLWKRD